jgi:hypothetical protein
MPLRLRQLPNIAGDVVIKLTDAINGELNNRDKANLLTEIIQHKGFITKSKDNKTKAITKVFRNVKAISVEYNDNMNAAKTLGRRFTGR